MGTHVDGGAETQDLPGPRSGRDTARMIVAWCRGMSTDPAPGSVLYAQGWNNALLALATRIEREYDLGQP